LGHNFSHLKHHHVLIFIDRWEELYARENDELRGILVRD
jgi:hypothetical protein